MIVKLNRWKKADFRKLINYIDRDKRRCDGGVNAIFHNTSYPSVDETITDFYENDHYRRRRKGGVAIYHEILSFHEKDSSNLTLDILNDIARKYIEIRGEGALCFAKPHIHDRHVHIHFAFSGTECFSSKTLRLDNKAFRKVKREIERYQIEKYPELSNSVVYHKEKKKKKEVSDREYQLKKRTQKQSDKDFVIRSLNKIFKRCTGFDSFLEILKKEGFQEYTYRSKVNGIKYNGRKYRFKTLGLGPERFQELEKRIRILQNYRSVLLKKKKEKEMKTRVSSEFSRVRSEIGETISNQKYNIVLKTRELRKFQRGKFQRQLRR